jgi:hypothetical protein
MKKTSPVPFLLISFLVLAAAGCPSPAQELGRTAPVEIRGVWVCDDPDYAGRRLEILEEALLFYTEEWVFDPYIIRSIQVEQGSDGTSYLIEHSGWEGGSLNLSLYLRSSDSTIVFGNQPLTVWRKQPPGS